MASVPLEFTAPAQDNLVALRIYEAASALGPFVQIERVTAIGTYPNWITNYNSANGSGGEQWYTIAWEDEDGGLSEQSNPVKIGTQTVPGEIADRVTQRDSTLNRTVAVQEAEAALNQYFGVDPYTLTLADVTYRQLRGFTNYVLAVMLLQRIVQGGGTADQITVGLVTLKSSTGGGTLSVREAQNLINQASNDLGFNTGLILRLERAMQPALVEILEP